MCYYFYIRVCTVYKYVYIVVACCYKFEVAIVVPSCDPFGLTFGHEAPEWSLRIKHPLPKASIRSDNCSQ